MGKGVSYMEDDYRWHGVPPTVEQAERALVELGTTFEAWTDRLRRYREAAVAPSVNGAR
jgi:hypothetical protein